MEDLQLRYNYLECCLLCALGDIAMGRRDLHKEGTRQRDVKASKLHIHRVITRFT